MFPANNIRFSLHYTVDSIILKSVIVIRSCKIVMHQQTEARQSSSRESPNDPACTVLLTPQLLLTRETQNSAHANVYVANGKPQILVPMCTAS